MGREILPAACQDLRGRFLVQLESSEAPSHIFSDSYAYFSSFSDTWLQHARAYADDMVARFWSGRGCAYRRVAAMTVCCAGLLERGLRVTRHRSHAANCAAAAEALGVTTEGIVSLHRHCARIWPDDRGPGRPEFPRTTCWQRADVQDFVWRLPEDAEPEEVAPFDFLIC